MCLLVGPTGVGKTLLLKRLSTRTSFTGKEVFENLSEVPATVATVGSNLVTVTLQKKQDVTVRELGGSMGPIWYNYYKDTNAVIYMIDISNALQISAACIQLMMLLSHEDLINTPVLILLNKIDMPTRLPMSKLESLLRLQDIIKSSTQKISVSEVSAHSGQGLQEVLRWIQQSQK